MEVNFKRNSRYGIVLGVTLLTSCLFVKAPEQKVDVNNVALSPLPDIEMSDVLVRTRAGDMIALLPKGWVFLDTKSQSSTDVIAVAVDSDYTMSIVFSGIPNSESHRETLAQEGVLGLARIAYSKHARKTAGATRLVGTYGTAQLGPRTFGTYEFSASGGAMRTKCAVFTSSAGNHYEFALVPMAISGKDVPPDAELQRIFRSMLATIQY
jgi:hypothetical protein